MKVRSIGTFVFVGVLLSPLAWMVVEGPKVAFVEIFGGLVAMSFLFVRRQLMAWTRVVPALAFGLVYAACAYFVNEPRDLFPYKAAILLLFYGFLTGLSLRRLAQDGHQKAVASAMVLFSLVMAGIAFDILTQPGTAHVVSEASVGAEMSRGNVVSENDTITYLSYFSIANIIIGLIPFTLFGLSLFPVLLTARTLTIRCFVLGAILLGAYINIQIATRTTFAASTVSSLLILAIVFRTVPLRRRLIFGGLLAVLSIGGYVYATRNKDIFHFLANRFVDVAQDSRLAIWRESLRILAVTPEGGGIRRLTAHFWAHNLFLDVGLANGWIALAAMMAFCAVGFIFVLRSFRKESFSISSANVIMLGWLVSGFCALMVLPPLVPLLAMLYIGVAYFSPYKSFAESEDA